MTDIMICSGENCPLKKKCYRYKAKINYLHQSYFMEAPYDKKKNECVYFFDKEEMIDQQIEIGKKVIKKTEQF